MPELAEVETTRRALEPLLGARLKQCAVFDPRLSHLHARAGQAVGSALERVDRRGKYLLLTFSSGLTLVVHLRMTGSLLLDAQPPVVQSKHVRLRLQFEADARQHVVALQDPRRFATVELMTSLEVDALLAAKLGPDPLIDPAGYERTLLLAVAERRSPIKTILLDQRAACGTGNYMADEACFAASISPFHPARALTAQQGRALVEGLQAVISRSLQFGGMSMRDYMYGNGQRGEMQHHLAVYGRGAEPCPRCHTPLASGKLGGRSTTWCRVCQPTAPPVAP